jgi:hypothetical protein
MPTKNLWGDLPVVDDVVTPLRMVREQANILRQATRGLLHASITTTPLSEGRMQHNFYLVAPLLNDYRHLLFSVEHGIDPYPTHVSASVSKKPVPCKTQTAFENLLKIVLTRDDTRKAVASLMANSQAIKAAA